MASGGSFAIRIVAVDAATAKINGVNKALAGMRAPVENLHKSLSKFSDLSGLTKGFSVLRNAIGSTVSALAKMVPALGALTGAGIIAGMAAMVKTWTQYAQQLQVTSAWLGIMPSQLQTLQNANRLLGGSAEAAAKAYEGLDDALQDAVAGRNIDLLRLSNALGLSIRKMGLEAKTAGEVMPELFDRIKQLADSGRLNPAMQRAIAKAFHLTPEQMRIAAKGGWAAMKQIQDEAAKHSLKDDEVEKLAGLAQKITNFTLALETFGQRVALALEPFLSPLMQQLEEWFSKPENIQKTADIIQTIVENIAAFAKTINKVVEGTTGWTTAIELLGGALLISFLSPLLRIAATLARISGLRTLPALSAAMVAWNAYQKAQDPETYNPANWSTDSPWWKGMPEQQQRQYPNSPVSQAEKKAQGGAENPAEKEQKSTWGGWLANRLGFKQGGDWLSRQAGYGPKSGSGEPGKPTEPGVPYQPGNILGMLGASGDQYNAFAQSVAGIEHARYDQMGGSSGRFAGRYQMGGAEIRETAARLGEKAPSTEAFLHDPQMQERYFEAYTAGHHEYLMKNSPKYAAASPEERLKILAYAHNQGPGGAMKWLNTGVAGRDAFNTSGTTYSNAVGKSLALLPRGNTTAKLSGGIKIDINNSTQNSVSASSSGGLLGAPKVVQPMAGYA